MTETPGDGGQEPGPVTAAAGRYARLDELTAIAARFEAELLARPADAGRLARGHGRAMAARTAEIDRLLAAGVPAAGIGEHLEAPPRCLRRCPSRPLRSIGTGISGCGEIVAPVR